MTIIFKNKKVKLSNIALSIALLLLMFSAVLSSYFPLLKNSDEIIAVYAAFSLIKKLISSKQCTVFFVKYWLLLFLCILIGVISNYESNLVANFEIILFDAFKLIKVSLVFFYVLYFIKKKDVIQIIDFLLPIIKILSFIIFAFGICNFVIDIGMTYDMRYGIRSYKFIFNNPGDLGAVVIGFFALFICSHKNCKKYYIMNIISVILTLRAGCIGGLFIIILCNLIIKQKFKWYYTIPLVGISILVGRLQINSYLLNTESLRYTLIKYGIITANNYFPLGSGFATYGSDLAYKYYSELYIQYGFINIWGFNQVNGSYINDNFWPMMIGQIGYVGAFIFLILLFNQFLYINKSKLTPRTKATALGIFLFLLIGSLGSPVLISYIGTYEYFIIALLLRSEYD